MNKMVLKVAFVAVVAMVGSINILTAQKNTDLSELELANVEALGQDVNDLCPNGCFLNGNGCYCNAWYENMKEAGPIVGEEEEEEDN